MSALATAFRRGAVVAAALLIMPGCATNPVTGEQDFVLMSEADEVALGASYHQQILRQYSAYDDPELQSYVTRIGQDLAARSHRSGMVRGSHFLHPQMGFALSAPEGWRIGSFPSYVAFVPPSREAFLQLDVAGVQADGEPERELLARLEAESLDEGRALSGDFPGYTGLGYARTPYGARITRFAGWVIGAARDEQGHERYDQTFLSVAESFRKLSPAERAQAKTRRVVIEPAPADGYAAAAEDSPLEDAAAQLRLLNGDFPDGEVEGARSIKVVR